MAKRKRNPVGSFTRFNVTVEATSARIGRVGPDVLTLAPEGESDSTIEIESLTDKPALKDIRRVVIFVHCSDDAKGNPGAAIDANVVWQVVISLPTPQFTHLLSLVHSERLRSASLGIENLSRGLSLPTCRTNPSLGRLVAYAFPRIRARVRCGVAGVAVPNSA